MKKRKINPAPASGIGINLGVSLLIIFTVIGIWSCSKKSKIIPIPLVITISPTSKDVETNKTQQFTASATRNGKLVSVNFTWSVTPVSLGSISTTGLFTAGSSEGPGTVTATAENISATATVTVREPPLVIVISPTSANVNTNSTKQFTASATRGGTPEAVSFTWSVTPSSLGSISATGLFTAGSSEVQGEVTVSAEGVRATAKVIVGEMFPFYIHKDKNDSKNHYVAAIYWADFGHVPDCFELDDDCTDTPDGSANSFKFIYKKNYELTTEWCGGFGWVDPWDCNQKDIYGGYDLTGATKLTFWAKCDPVGTGSKEISVQVGIIYTNATHPDTSVSKLENISLETDWKKYEVNLIGKDLSRIQFGFLIWAWTPPYTFYIDEIKFEQ